jgi:hypothetical protein
MTILDWHTCGSEPSGVGVWKQKTLTVGNPVKRLRRRAFNADRPSGAMIDRGQHPIFWQLFEVQNPSRRQLARGILISPHPFLDVVLDDYDVCDAWNGGRNRCPPGLPQIFGDLESVREIKSVASRWFVAQSPVVYLRNT